MIITSLFTDAGAPKTGLSPTITIYDVSDGTALVTDAAMTEVDGGFYKYDFTTFDVTEDYAFVADGGSGQAEGERYAYGSSKSTGAIEFIKDIEGGKWKIDPVTKQHILYKDDNTTEVARFWLKDINGNATVNNAFERERV